MDGAILRVVLEYPAWFTALDRTRIEQARTEHGPPLHPDTGDRRFAVIFDVRYPSDADARAALLAELQVVADVLSPYHQHREWADAARCLRDALIVDVDRYRPKDIWPTLKEFVTAIEQVLAEEHWWPRQKLVRRDGPVATTPQYPHQAAWLAEQMRVADVTPSGLEQFNGPDGKTTQRLLDGHGTKRDDIKHKIVHALNEANRYRGRKSVPFTLTDMPDD